MTKLSRDRLRILIIDDHVLLREALCAVLSKEASFEIVGWTEPEGALVGAKAVQPDIVLLAIASGSSDWSGLARQMLQGCPNARIVLFTSIDDEKLYGDALQLGVHGYLHKTLSAKGLLTALQLIAQGEQEVIKKSGVELEPNVRRRVAQYQPFTQACLSLKDREILRLASQGNSNKEIGFHLCWSEITIKRRMQEIYHKLQARDRAHAVAEALRSGLI
jgi:DNA-binding NarL/FixJ family response regulator